MNAPNTLDITTPQAFSDPATLLANYQRMRAEDPVCFVEPAGYRPYWAVTKHADIIEIEKQNERFINDPRLIVMPAEAEQMILDATGGSNHLIRSLVDMDNPDHHKYRILTQAWFMPGNVKKRAEAVEGLAKHFIDKMADLGGECDFVRDVAVWFPLRVVMQILGVPEEDEPRMLQLTQELFGGEDPEFGRSEFAIDANVVIDFHNYFSKITADRRANPKDDVASVIANAEIDGEPIPELEAMSYYMIVATAGHDTTSSSTAGGLLALMENPDQMAMLKKDMSLLPGAVEEMIRWVTPVKHFCRTATEDYELRGRQIKKGDTLVMCYWSGNRDEEVFANAARFDITRSPNPQIAFGHGAHKCLGMHLARMEMAALYRELLARLDHVELAGEPTYVAANFVSGLKSLPIRYKMK